MTGNSEKFSSEKERDQFRESPAGMFREHEQSKRSRAEKRTRRREGVEERGRGERRAGAL